jgi:translation initiation factor 3 subunit B
MEIRPEDEIVADILRDRPTLVDLAPCCIVVDNLPQVGPDRIEKLKGILLKKFTPELDKADKPAIHMPVDAKGLTKGFAFCEYLQPASAHSVAAAMNGFKLDKNHALLVNPLNDVERSQQVPDEYVPVDLTEFKPRPDLRQWLRDSRHRDQFAVRYGPTTGVYWNGGGVTDPEDAEVREYWTESFLSWSPRGSYLATVHQLGVAIWGGEKWQQLNKFAHFGVRLLEWSPCERYLMTFSPEVTDSKADPKAIVVWDVRSGRKLRAFQHVSEREKHPWPVFKFKWSACGNYLARISLKKDGIDVYSIPAMTRQTHKIADVRNFEWSPSDTHLAYWLPESTNTPARVVIADVPDWKELAIKNLVNVSSCAFRWHPQGDYLCVKVDRYTKSKKNTFTNFEIFRIREKAIPVEAIELKDTITAFLWEPHGDQLAIIHGDSPKISVSFYKVETAAKAHELGKIVCRKTLEKKAVNALFWSPAGQYIILAGLGNLNGTLEFFDTSDMTTLAMGDHFMCTDVAWDPSGRFVTTSVSAWHKQMENGYFIWSFTGKQILRKPLDLFYQFVWRPRPALLLAEDARKQVKKDLKKWSIKYDRLDTLLSNSASQEVQERRARLQAEYKAFRDKVDAINAEEHEKLMALRGGQDREPEYVEGVEVVQSVFISEKVEVVPA